MFSNMIQTMIYTRIIIVWDAIMQKYSLGNNHTKTKNRIVLFKRRRLYYIEIIPENAEIKINITLEICFQNI